MSTPFLQNKPSPNAGSSSQKREIRLAVVVSHAIQHFAPWHREVAKLPGVRLKVFFCSDWGANSYFDWEFGTQVQWDIPLLEGYEYEILPSKKELKHFSFWALDNPTVGEALARFQPDVVQLFGYAYRTNWRVRGWCNRHGIPILLYSDSNTSAVPAFWKRAPKSVIVRWFYKGVSGALVTGDNNREYHRRFGVREDRLFEGCLPIDARRLRSSVGNPQQARAEIRERYEIPQDAFVLVLSGKLSARKSPMHVAQAVERCVAKGQPVWALIVGEGEERTVLEQFISEHNLKNVVLTGFVNQGAIGKYYAAADVLVSTSAYDPHPLIVPEAGCFGLPVIVSDRLGCIGPTDTARAGVNALVFPWGDVTALVECILELKNNADKRNQFSAAARRIAESQDVTVAALQLKNAAERLWQATRLEMNPRE